MMSDWSGTMSSMAIVAVTRTLARSSKPKAHSPAPGAMSVLPSGHVEKAFVNQVSFAK